MFTKRRKSTLLLTNDCIPMHQSVINSGPIGSFDIMSSLYSPALAREMTHHSFQAQKRATEHLLKAALSQLRSINAALADEIEDSPEKMDELRTEYRALLADTD